MVAAGCGFGILPRMPRSRVAGSRRRLCLTVGRPVDPVVSGALRAEGFDVESAETDADGLAAVDRKPWEVVLAAGQGVSALRAIVERAAQKHPEVPVVVLANTARLQDAVDAMQLGVADFIAPPFDAEAVVARLRKLLPDRPVQVERSEPAPSLEHCGLVGSSAAMTKMSASIARISRYKTNVLVLGESGVGKELVARALHRLGARRNHLFVPLNCATLGREILENELFGHERGAFTGANERKKGLFELADGGTLFLDEISELDPSTQAKLLRVLERNEFRRVGGTTKIKVDLSLIAATNRNLEEAIATHRFREDLYYRLKVVTIVIPPLRERREDIPALIDAFIADFNRRNGGKIKGISPQALRRLMEHDWPGNVRELKNALESGAIMATGETIGIEDFENAQFLRTVSVRPPAPPKQTSSAGTASGERLWITAGTSLAEAERFLIIEHLRHARTKADAARSLGIGLRTLYTKIRELKLDAWPGRPLPEQQRLG
jgi:DNA-binding NtrC family response regulator